jgi:HEAT repeat protein
MSLSRGRVLLSVASLAAVLAGFPLAERAHGQCMHHGHHGGMHPPGGGFSPMMSMMQQQQLQQMLLQQQMLQQRVLQQQVLQLKQLDREVRELTAGGVPAVKAGLKSIRAETRWAAARVVGLQKLDMPEELIPLLTDSNGHVRQSARQALVELSADALLAKKTEGKASAKRVDFGPSVQAGTAAQKAAAHKWRTWWERQESDPKDAKVLLAKNVVRPTAPKMVVPVAAAAPADEVTRLSNELVRATAAHREAALTKLRDSKGAVYTDALADAILSLNGESREQARDALVERLTRMKSTTLSNKLQDDNPEVRRAAALACAMKEGKSLIPDLIALLDDPERPVALAAKTALKSLTGENFGPVVGVALVDRTRAIGDWKEWWRKQNGQ